MNVTVVSAGSLFGPSTIESVRFTEKDVESYKRFSEQSPALYTVKALERAVRVSANEQEESFFTRMLSVARSLEK